MPALKPLLVFGLRGTLVERIHVRSLPEGMPAPDLTVGLVKVWLRPHLMEVLHDLQPHCRFAIWSSTTARNSHPLVRAVFESNVMPAALPLPEGGAAVGRGFGAAPRAASSATTTAAAAAQADSAAAADGAGGNGAGRGGRFGKKRRPAAEGAQESAAALAATPEAATPPKIDFEFVWTREHTRADDFRRLNASLVDDAHATVKDLSQVFTQYPAIAQPQNTILVDDTPSKAKLHAANYLWLDSCAEQNIKDETGLCKLRDFVLKEVVQAEDVRALLPRRIRI